MLTEVVGSLCIERFFGHLIIDCEPGDTRNVCVTLTSELSRWVFVAYELFGVTDYRGYPDHYGSLLAKGYNLIDWCGI